MLAAFSFDVIGAKEKANKKKSAEKYSRSAEREEGYAPSTAPPFEKGGRKLFIILIVRLSLSAS